VNTALVERLDALLPQTQCTRCGYDGCLPYAQAIARGEADVNRCPPGGTQAIAALARAAGRAPLPLDPACGAHGPLAVARIDEERCIGCTLCIEACPVDAIIGAAKRMHAVVASLCSGCELCIAPCPVDCIVLEPVDREWTRADADAARIRHRERAERLANGEPVERRGLVAPADESADRAATVAAAVARARARRARATPRAQ
jgi:Na+-translocating ferredoxin:NAD+ oxidoreductase subunit B